jgi:endonuclease V-like protein UPF0215 family
MRADMRVDGMAYAHAEVGGDDATLAVKSIYSQLDRSDINVLMIEGAVLSWFNIIDLQEVWEVTEKPLFCISYDESPGLMKYIREYFSNPDEKIRRYHRLGERQPILLKTGYQVYLRVFGATIDEARMLINKFTRDGRIPEPLRLAGLAARAACRDKYDR